MRTFLLLSLLWLSFVCRSSGNEAQPEISLRDFSISEYNKLDFGSAMDLLGMVASETGLVSCREEDWDSGRDSNRLQMTEAAPLTFYGLLDLLRSMGYRVSNKRRVLHFQTLKSLTYASTPMDLPFGPFTASGKLGKLNEALAGYFAKKGMQSAFTYANPNKGRQEEFTISSRDGETCRQFLLRIAQENGIGSVVELVPISPRNLPNLGLPAPKPQSDYLIAVYLR